MIGFVFLFCLLFRWDVRARCYWWLSDARSWHPLCEFPLCEFPCVSSHYLILPRVNSLIVYGLGVSAPTTKAHSLISEGQDWQQNLCSRCRPSLQKLSSVIFLLDFRTSESIPAMWAFSPLDNGPATEINISDKRSQILDMPVEQSPTCKLCFWVYLFVFLSFFDNLYMFKLMPKVLEDFLQKAFISMTGYLIQFFIFGSPGTIGCQGI